MALPLHNDESCRPRRKLLQVMSGLSQCRYFSRGSIARRRPRESFTFPYQLPITERQVESVIFRGLTYRYFDFEIEVVLQGARQRSSGPKLKVFPLFRIRDHVRRLRTTLAPMPRRLTSSPRAKFWSVDRHRSLPVGQRDTRRRRLIFPALEVRRATLARS